MAQRKIDPHRAALLICDLQNDFLHPKGAYGRAGQTAVEIAALPARVKPLADAMRNAGGLVVSTHFTLVPGRDGAPMIAPHLQALRPFLATGDFAPGSWGQAIVDDLKPVDVTIEKVAYSAFYQTRLEWVLRKLGVDQLVVTGIVTNGGVASTVRDAHVREIEVVVASDGCAAFTSALHGAALAGLAPVARIQSIADCMAEIGAA
jgi:ureidoacrylate peracid hydrolase